MRPDRLDSGALPPTLVEVTTGASFDAAQIAGEPVVIVEHDPRWFDLAEHEIGRLRRALEGIAVRIEHVGSTAVAGLAAKPVIDLQISVSEESTFVAAGAQLSAAGYAYIPVEGFEDYPFYRRRDEAGRVMHVHLGVAGSLHEHRHLAVRDYLRSNEEARNAYGELKLQLVARHGGDRASYISGKDEFVRGLEQAALQANPLPSNAP